jgi:hypothetical protein
VKDAPENGQQLLGHAELARANQQEGIAGIAERETTSGEIDQKLELNGVRAGDTVSAGFSPRLPRPKAAIATTASPE